ncbi:MAG TPA: ornithine carbamoyltransferase [bacterium]|nr:ornithine carbamoyltransferase [bacterium]
MNSIRPEIRLRHKDLLTLADLEPSEILAVLEAGAICKAKHKEGQLFVPLLGKSIGMVFHKPSARTRISFELGAFQLGGHAVLLKDEEIGIGTRESVEDVARLFSRYFDGVVVRTFDQTLLQQLAENATIPVINALTDYEHPCQILADLMTVQELGKPLKGLKVAFIGDGNNVATAWAFAAGKLGFHLVVASPKGFELHDAVVREAMEDGVKTGGKVTRIPDPTEAARGADVVYTDVWTSMGQEAERAERLAAFARYQVGEALMKHAKPDAVVMHCLPAHRGEEISAETFERHQKVIFDEAENRLHVQKGLMTLLMGRQLNIS